MDAIENQIGEMEPTVLAPEWIELAAECNRRHRRIYARELCETDRFILWQEHVNGQWDYVCQRVSSRAHGWIERLQRFTPTPYNPYAHGDA